MPAAGRVTLKVALVPGSSLWAVTRPPFPAYHWRRIGAYTVGGLASLCNLHSARATSTYQISRNTTEKTAM